MSRSRRSASPTSGPADQYADDVRQWLIGVRRQRAAGRLFELSSRERRLLWAAIASARILRTIRARPIDLRDAGKAAMLPPAPAVGWVNRVQLGRDYYARIGSNDYCVGPAAIGRLVDTHADLFRIEGRHEGCLVAG